MKKSTLYILTFLFASLFSIQNTSAQTCEIGMVAAEVLPCNESGMFFVVLDFNYANVGNEGFHVQGNGNNYGNFFYENLPVEIGPLAGDGSTVYEFVVIDNQFADCSNWTAIDPVDCSAGGDCAIWEVTAAPTPCNDDGFFWVVLDFGYENVGDLGFTVHGNGNNYGTFQYENLPVEIGPLEGDGVTVYEFGVTDVQFEGCSNWTVIDPVDCSGGGDCAIWEVTATPTPCNDDGFFWVVLDFEYINVGDLGFTVHGNGNNYGTFQYENLPVEIGPLEGDGVTVYEFGVTDVQFEGCSNWTVIDPVDCGAGGDCNIWDLVVDSHPCSEGYFNVYLNFNYENVSGEGFKVWVNEELYGEFSYEELPLNIGPFPGDGTTVYHFFVRDIVFEGCSDAAQIGPIDCGSGGNCHIWEVVVDDHPCQEGYFYVYLNFNYENVSGEGFTLMVNEDLYGYFSYEDLPLWEVGPFLGDGTTIYHFNVFDQVYEDCGASRDFGPKDCGGGGNCEIGMLNIDVLDCVEGMFNVQLDFDYANVGDQGFKVWVNEDLYGQFWYEELPVNLGPLAGDGSTVYHFLVRDVAHPECASDGSIDPVDCNGGGDCHIWDLVPTILPCNEDGLFMVLLNFNYENIGEEGFTVYINEEDHGGFYYEDVPVEVGPLAGDGTTVYNITVRDDQYEGCYDETAFAVDCGGMPLLANMTSEVTSCQDDIFYIQIDFDPEYQGGSGFIVMSNLGGQGIYSYESLPLTLGPFTTDGITEYYFIVQDAENGMAGNWKSLPAFTCDNLGLVDRETAPVLMVYPNPAIRTVNFRNSGHEAARLWISNSNGLQVRRADIMPGQVIRLDYLKPGLYFYRAVIDGSSVTGKFIVQQD